MPPKGTAYLLVVQLLILVNFFEFLINFIFLWECWASRKLCFMNTSYSNDFGVLYIDDSFALISRVEHAINNK